MSPSAIPIPTSITSEPISELEQARKSIENKDREIRNLSNHIQDIRDALDVDKNAKFFSICQRALAIRGEFQVLQQRIENLKEANSVLMETIGNQKKLIRSAAVETDSQKVMARSIQNA